MVTGPDLDYSRYFWQGQKVRLRPLRKEDAEQSLISTLDSPARQLLAMGIELPTSVELLRSFLEARAGCKDTEGEIIFAIETLEGIHVGGIALHSRDDKNGLFGFAVEIGRGHRQKGYGQEAVRILLKYGFWERRYQKCNSACADVNEASIALHMGLGFAEEGRRRRHIFFNGQYHDEILFGITREEFDAVEEKSSLDDRT